MPKGIYQHKPLSGKTKKKISEMLRGKKRSPYSKEWINKIVETRKRNGSYKHTEETKRKMSESHRGRKLSEETRRKIGLANAISMKGNKHMLGKHWKVKDTSKMGHSAWNKGKKIPQMTGDKHPKWIFDRSLIKRQTERNNPEYKQWRLNVWLKDNFRCRINNKDCSGKIIAHHILSWSQFPELRYNINNGITLCHAHHPRRRAEEKRLIPFFQGLVSVSKELICH